MYEIEAFGSPNALSLSKVEGVPALVFYKDGKKMGVHYGIYEPMDIKKLEEKYFK